MTRRSTLISAALLCLVGTSAWADGMPATYSAAPSRCGAGPFSGPYIGAAVGYANQRVEATDEIFGGSFKDRDGSVTFGGYVGYNWQCDRFLLGAETDFNYIDTSPTATVNGFALNSQTDWYGTLRARAGFVVHDSLLLYATGGLAYANVDHTFSDSGAPAGPFSQSNSNTTTGWTLGGGGELLHGSNWLVRAEAFYVDLGSETITYVQPTPCLTCTAITKWDDEFWVARIGVSYKFGHREEVVPLK